MIIHSNKLLKRFSKKPNKIECFSHDWADDQLRFSIGVLQGKFVICSRKGRIQLALISKALLKEHNYAWHSDRIDNWIHRTAILPKLKQPKADLSQREREENSL